MICADQVPEATHFRGRYRPPTRVFAVVALALAALTVVVYGRTLGHDFVNFDDQAYVTENPAVQNGLAFRGLSQAFGFLQGNWHPLTWFSHMLDVSLFGMRPWGHHLVNVLLHGANAILVFVVVANMTGALWASALVSALLAVHPLNVESVAWVAERKSVLSSLFFWLTIAAWLRWMRRPSSGRYLCVLALFSLGLMAKSTLVTLPVLLLVLDWWPLGRLVPLSGTSPRLRTATAGGLLAEKVPLLALAVLGSALTWRAQFTAPVSLFSPPVATRIANAFVSYVAYLYKSLWPAKLAVLYPYPTAGIPLLQFVGAGLVILATTAIVVARARKRPYLATGWLWYLGTLVPMIGFIHSGAQARADRYMYLPLVGVFLAVVWLAKALLPVGAPFRRQATVLAALITAGLAGSAWVQTSYWHDSLALTTHTVGVTKGNFMMLNNLAAALLERGRMDEAKAVLEELIQIKPDHVNGLFNLGSVAARQGRYREAVLYFQRGLRLRPDNLHARFALAQALSSSAEPAAALEQLQLIARQNPTFPNLRLQMALTSAAIRSSSSAQPGRTPAR